MAQGQTQVQEQKQEQRLQQSVTQQQLLQSQLIELPLQQMIERINTEMHDNPALETSTEDPDGPMTTDGDDFADSQESPEDYDTQREREERQDALDAALESFGRDDEELPVYQNNHYHGEDHEDILASDSQSFYDQLLEQVSEMELSEQERYVMEYLIRSLDDDGLLRASLESIADELAIYHNIDLTEQQLETILRKLQQLDPPGIGARTLQECLLLQTERKPDTPLRQQMHSVITHHFDEFTKKHWDKIQKALKLNDVQMDELLRELRRLNPKPGASMGETIGRSMQQIIPDFIVDTLDDGTVVFSLNNNDIPHLYVSQSFADLLKEYQNNKEGMSRQMKEALLYTRQKVDAAQSFIDAIRYRYRTLNLTMDAIIQLQHRFFEEGDEALLRPMILKDVAERTGLDLSTISRVTSSKYVQTRWGIFPLKHFFSDGVVTQNGEELSTHEIKAKLRELVDSEEKRKPLSDDRLTKLLGEAGYPIARRTVAKYREQMGIPIARLRKN